MVSDRCRYGGGNPTGRRTIGILPRLHSGAAPIDPYSHFLSNFLVLQPITREEIIQKIGGEVGRRGSCLVSEEELVVIYDGVVEDSKRFACIRDIAIGHHWAFELPGRMTSVTFKELPPENLHRPISEQTAKTAAITLPGLTRGYDLAP